MMDSWKDIRQLCKDFKNPKNRIWIIVWVLIILFGGAFFKSFISKFGSPVQKTNIDTHKDQHLEINDSPGAVVTQVNGDLTSDPSKEFFKKQVLKLLAQDAINIYTVCTVWIKLSQDPNRLVLPQEVPLMAWNDIKRNGDFIYLQTDKEFEAIIGKFRDFEKLNEQVERAKAGDRGAYDMSWGLSTVIILKENAHIALLKLFKDDEQVKEFVQKHNINLP